MLVKQQQGHRIRRRRMAQEIRRNQGAATRGNTSWWVYAQEPFHGYYIHGKAPSSRGDWGHTELLGCWSQCIARGVKTRGVDILPGPCCNYACIRCMAGHPGFEGVSYWMNCEATRGWSPGSAIWGWSGCFMMRTRALASAGGWALMVVRPLRCSFLLTRQFNSPTAMWRQSGPRPDLLEFSWIYMGVVVHHISSCFRI